MKRRHEYAQHFLRRPALVKELIGHSSIKKTDTVLDIGAGSGVITSALASRARSVIAVENEARTIVTLRENMIQFPNVTVVEDSILTMSLPDSAYKVFANIPFHLSADIVRRLTTAEVPPEDIYLIVQVQFARKLLVSSDHFTGMLGAQLSPWWNVKIRRPLRKTDFWPHPNVDTVLLQIKPRDNSFLPLAYRTDFWKFVERCFHDQVYFTKLDVPSKLDTKKQRPSELSPPQWISLFSQVKKIATSLA